MGEWTQRSGFVIQVLHTLRALNATAPRQRSDSTGPVFLPLPVALLVTEFGRQGRGAGEATGSGDGAVVATKRLRTASD